MTGPLLSVAGLVHRFGDGQGLFSIPSLVVDEGACVILTGDNGTGKSTLLRVLAGLAPARATSATFAGRTLDLENYPDAVRRDVVYVHQQPYVFARSVAANVGYGLARRGIGGAMRRRRIDAAIGWAGLDRVRDVPPAKLSGGEKQRVALARAWVLEPRLLLLDEPTANLDATARGQVLSLLRTLADAGRTVIVACHDRELIDLPHAVRWHLAGGALERSR
ncbi:MAG: energy-coupling factor ABC transporter ATP-binding protein [Betaproteobacteria bacterium]